jgi:tetratricopeptide (TPR) repeat protein
MQVRVILMTALAGLLLAGGCSQPDPIDEAAKAYDQGHALLKDHPERAIPYFDTAIHLNTKYVAAYADRGRARQSISHSKDDFRSATADFDRAIELDPKCADARTYRGLNRLNEGNSEGAIEDFDAALAVNPKMMEAFNNRGMAHARRGEFKEAIADFASALELNPKYAGAYCNRGDARRDSGDTEGALSDYSKAIEIDSRFSTAYNNRAMLEQTLGKIPEALNDLDHAVKVDPKFAEAWANRATLRRTQPQPDLKAAMADADKAIEVDPELPAAYSARGFVRLDSGDAARALEDFNKAVSLNPDILYLAQALTGQGTALRRAHNDLNAAIDSFDKAIRADPQYYLAYSARGLAKHDSKDFRGAIADYSQAIELSSKEAGLYHNRGVAYLEFGEQRNNAASQHRSTKSPAADDEEKEAKEQWKLAIQDFDKAIKLDSNMPLTYVKRGVARHLLGDEAAAVADLDRAIELKSDLGIAYIQRGLIWELKGKFTNALDDYNRAVEANRYDAIAYARRGLLLLQYQQDVRANQDFEVCYQLRPELKKDLEKLIGQIKDARKQQARAEGKN